MGKKKSQDFFCGAFSGLCSALVLIGWDRLQSERAPLAKNIWNFIFRANHPTEGPLSPKQSHEKNTHQKTGWPLNTRPIAIAGLLTETNQINHRAVQDSLFLCVYMHRDSDPVLQSPFVLSGSVNPNDALRFEYMIL